MLAFVVYGRCACVVHAAWIGLNIPFCPQVSCGSLHTCLLTVDGEVYMWGRNLEGQLGTGSRQDEVSCGQLGSVSFWCGQLWSAGISYSVRFKCGQLGSVRFKCGQQGSVRFKCGQLGSGRFKCGQLGSVRFKCGQLWTGLVQLIAMIFHNWKWPTLGRWYSGVIEVLDWGSEATGFRSWIEQTFHPPTPHHHHHQPWEAGYSV